MSPYIVTTKKPVERAVSLVDDREREVKSRRAVATLEEARDFAVRAVRIRVAYDEFDRGTDSLVSEANTLPEQGGTVTLPDGTVIEVEPKDDRFFLDLLTGEGVTTVAHGIAAFNEAQGGPR